ncbi:MAG: TrkA family potassium uptake protein [Spirochaetaceae bacterium]|nr:MAG: TrkA family potassium uptake protein [Spirochaetaceae bacterium]
MAKSKVYAVIGLGTFGRKVCEVLSQKGGQVIALDEDPEAIDKIKSTVTAAILLDATDEGAIEKAPLDDVDVGIVAIGDDIEASILVTALLKKRGIPYILARAVSEIHQTVLRQVGANEVVNLEIDEGVRIALRLISPDVLDTIPLSKDYSFAEVQVPRVFFGQTVRNIQLREKFNLNIISIKHIIKDVDDVGNPVSREELILPDADAILTDGDILLVVGNNDSLGDLVKME